MTISIYICEFLTNKLQKYLYTAAYDSNLHVRAKIVARQSVKAASPVDRKGSTFNVEFPNIFLKISL
jgi:hypothetical protein